MKSLFLTEVEKARQEARESVVRECLQRVARLVATFNGAIKYLPMLTDHPEMSDEEALAFARHWHAIAKERYRSGDEKWNNGIPYCRNQWKEPT